MNEIKLYEELSFIITYDNKEFPTPMTRNELERILNGNLKFLTIGNDLIAVSSIMRVEPRKVDAVDNMIYQISDSDLRSRLNLEVQRRRKNGERVNTQIVQNILNRLNK